MGLHHRILRFGELATELKTFSCWTGKGTSRRPAFPIMWDSMKDYKISNILIKIKCNSEFSPKKHFTAFFIADD